jgi:hypothetical protein
MLVILMSSVQAVHVCGLGEGCIPQPGATAQVVNVGSPDTFCAICASSHSPSLAAPLVCLPSIARLTEAALHGRVIRRSFSQKFALYIRPPPFSW